MFITTPLPFITEFVDERHEALKNISQARASQGFNNSGCLSV